jgi:hypothetical protein
MAPICAILRKEHGVVVLWMIGRHEEWFPGNGFLTYFRRVWQYVDSSC